MEDDKGEEDSACEREQTRGEGSLLDGLALDAEDLAKVCVFPIGVSQRLKTPPQKEAIIFLAGRMVPEKGILECAQALADILPSYPEWRLVIAGARRFEQATPNSYETKVAKAIEPLGYQAEMTGFIPLDQVRDWQERAAIAAAEPPDDPPGVSALPCNGPSLAVHGLVTAPKALVSLAEPIANSSQLILPSMTAPSCHRFSVTVDSYGGTNPLRIAEDAVV